MTNFDPIWCHETLKCFIIIKGICRPLNTCLFVYFYFFAPVVWTAPIVWTWLGCEGRLVSLMQDCLLYLPFFFLSISDSNEVGSQRWLRATGNFKMLKTHECAIAVACWHCSRSFYIEQFWYSAWIVQLLILIIKYIACSKMSGKGWPLKSEFQNKL